MTQKTILEQIQEQGWALGPPAGGVEYITVQVTPEEPIKIKRGLFSRPAALCYHDNNPRNYPTHLVLTCWRSPEQLHWVPVAPLENLETLWKQLCETPRPPRLTPAVLRDLQRIKDEEALRTRQQQQDIKFRIWVAEQEREREAARRSQQTKALGRREIRPSTFTEEEEEEGAREISATTRPAVTDWYAAQPKIVRSWTPMSRSIRAGLLSADRLRTPPPDPAKEIAGRMSRRHR